MKTKLYIANDNYELVAKCKKTNTIINDPNNLSGMLTKHIVNLYGDVNNLYVNLGFEKIWDCGLFKYKLSIDK